MSFRKSICQQYGNQRKHDGACARKHGVVFEKAHFLLFFFSRTAAGWLEESALSPSIIQPVDKSDYMNRLALYHQSQSVENSIT